MTDNVELADFSYTYSDNLPAVFKHLNISLAVTD